MLRSWPRPLPPCPHPSGALGCSGGAGCAQDPPPALQDTQPGLGGAGWGGRGVRLHQALTPSLSLFPAFWLRRGPWRPGSVCDSRDGVGPESILSYCCFLPELQITVSHPWPHQGCCRGSAGPLALALALGPWCAGGFASWMLPPAIHPRAPHSLLGSAGIPMGQLPPTVLQTHPLSHFPVSTPPIINPSYAKGSCCVEVGPWERLCLVALPIPNCCRAGVSALGPPGLGCRNGAGPPTTGSTARGAPAWVETSLQRHFNLESCLPAPSLPPPKLGGSGGHGVRSPMRGAGRRRPDACEQPACPLHRILQQ
ncbi:uncharacterized protein LOC129735903 [Falco cherrug]|uniref:uncharacterized protein LOC129735903 n=1 Tax=Falco cherrug TaxID=345164 RepID=UPI00247940D5|nr:uncharacterized protein LOC129735903 [Falco cherrug]